MSSCGFPRFTPPGQIFQLLNNRSLCSIDPAPATSPRAIFSGLSNDSIECDEGQSFLSLCRQPMGSTISSLQGFDEGDLSNRGKEDSVDPILEKLRGLHIVTPLNLQTTTDASLTEILLRRTSSQPSDSLDPTSTVNLFELYQVWQRATAEKAGKKQEELGYKIIGVEELSMKLLQRLKYAGRVMEASAIHLQEVHSLQDEILEVNRKLAKTIESYEKLSQKVDALGLQQKNIKPMAIVNPLHQGTDETAANILLPSEASHGSATTDVQ